MATGLTLVTGRGGRLAGRLLEALAGRGRQALGSDRRPQPGDLELDLAKPEAFRPPSGLALVYLAAALTRLAECQADPERSRALNVTAQLEVARRCLEVGARVVFLSTNQVVAGGADRHAPRAPSTMYGMHKAEAEAGLQELAGDRLAVVRLTKVLTRPYPLLEQWRRDLAEGRAIHPVREGVVAPISPETAVDCLIRVGEQARSGIWHLSADRDVGYPELADWVCRRWGYDPALVQSRPAVELGLDAGLFPAATRLDCSGLDELGMVVPSWQQAVELCLG